ncbi:ComEC/Rec2 family competence protein [Caulobacter sp. 17J80-11]|uniref:ComEC/Rec2 family competence protein n=1 Tax=Caulobacter sp. 17J80-11 TaxID=2763502 RepID=UPI001653715E|nr:ComEC/Rec2 family competence protein [Caulobacter sp. 17J80-11]MBC6980773.1 ComEC/Rec2 family competence protein [Caulobacter sp. 17J80-11]
MAGVRSGARDALAAQADRWPLWTPVAFGAGCALYFALRAEPGWGWIAGGFVFFLWLTIRTRRTRAPFAAILAATLGLCVAAGAGVAKLRSERVAAPVMAASGAPATMEAWVVDVASPGKGGARLVLAPVWIEGLTPEATPVRARLTVDGPAPAPGTAIRVRAILNPPPPPASPGAYDFARDAWFHSVGAVGFALGEARPAALDPAPWRLRAEMAVNAARWDLAERIVTRLGEAQGGIAAAMTTGHEAWIAQADVDAMRDSGLAHLLSISGLHMAIVGGFVFFSVRLGVAAWPWLALRVSGKKLAAVCGLVAVGGYLVLSGAPAPAERSAVTAAAAFAAILLDRRPISLNSLAAAAFMVLLLKPEAVVQPGFQMSFAATAALVALAEVWPRRVREISAPWPILIFQRAVSWTGLACMTSLVAGLATGPFAMQHFNRVAVYGLAANLAAAPLSSFVVMPFLALGAALEPIGLGGLFLHVAGWGVQATTMVGAWIAGLPGATRTVASAPAAALPIAFFGLLFVCLWKGRARWLGAPFAAAVLLWPRAEPPVAWIASDGAAAAVRIDDRAVALRPDAKAFAFDIWDRRRGLETAGDLEADRDALYACDRWSCVPKAGAPGLASWWGKKPPTWAKLSDLCRSAEVVTLRATVDRLPPACRGRLVLDAVDLARTGSVELWRRDGRWLALTAAELRGARPWVQ